MNKNINWNWVLIEILLIFVITCGLLATGFAYKIDVLAKEPQWNANLCIDNYNNCLSVDFYSQSDFVEYCKARNGLFVIDKLNESTCIEKKVVE